MHRALNRRTLAALALAALTSGCGHSTSAPEPAPTPSFQIGWYSDERASPDRLAAYQHLGVNLVLPYRTGETYTNRWLKAAAQHGIRLLLQPDWRWIEDGRLGELTAFVRHYQRAPALYGWYLYDEPDFNRLAPEKLSAAYRAIKAVDAHPVAVVFTTGGCRFGAGRIDPRYLAGFDLLMFDDYPFYQNLPGLNPLGEAREIDARCVASARRFQKLGPIMVLQAFGNHVRDGQFMWRDPTGAESACTFALATAAGAGGVLFWSDQRADAQVRHNVDSLIGQWHAGRQITSGSGLPQSVARLPAACSGGQSGFNLRR